MEEFMKTLQISIVLCVVILLCGAAFAQQPEAPTVTLNVPVHINKLHQGVKSVVIACVLNDANNRQIATKNYVISSIPADGNINQTATVVIQATEGHDITQATSYFAKLILEADGFNGVPAVDAFNIEFKVKDGTPLTPEVSGALNW
jgi:hypothetical protein